MIKAGDVLQGRYRIEKQIGAGGMGTVFVAMDERFNNTVAIKETLFTDQRLRKAFEREARLLNSLRHHALPRVSDHFSEENGQFIVMEYIAGEDLSEMMLKRRRAFPVADVLDWADQLLDALDFLHTQEMPVIHRDIKPQNLKLTPRGQIILLDFGLAKGNLSEADSPTAAKSVFGYSRSYASLEQIQGTGTDPRSDLYSLAATLYHLMAGVPPADALTRAMSVLNGERDPLIPAHRISAEIPFGVSEVLTRSMALNASHRPSSAAAMRELLREGANITEVSDEYETAQVNSPFAAAGTGAGASLFTQNTAVMSDQSETGVEGRTESEEETSVRTNPAGAPQRNIRIPVAANQSTVIQPLAEITESGRAKKSRFAAAAIAVGLLLAAGSALAGLYAFNSGVFHSTSRNAVTDKKSNSSAETLKQQPANNAVSNEFLNPATETTAAAATTTKPVNANVSIVNEPPVETVTRKESAPKIEDKAAIAGTAAPAPKNSKEAKVEPLRSRQTFVYRGSPETGDEDVVIEGEKIETDEVVIDKGKIYLKKPPKFPGGAIVKQPVFSPEHFKKLTPEQREKLQKAMRLQRMQVPRMEPMQPTVPAAPKPKPTEN